MAVRYSLRHHQICICNLRLGVSTNTTILPSFWLPVLPMERYVIFHLCMWALYRMSNLLVHVVFWTLLLINLAYHRGFTIKDMLKELNIDLNIPPFLEGHHQPGFSLGLFQRALCPLGPLMCPWVCPKTNNVPFGSTPKPTMCPLAPPQNQHIFNSHLNYLDLKTGQVQTTELSEH